MAQKRKTLKSFSAGAPPMAPQKKPVKLLATPLFFGQLAKQAEVPVKDVKKVIRSLPAVVSNELSSKGKTKVPGLGIFKVRTVPSRPATKMKMFGKMVEVAARSSRRKVVAFPVKELTEGALQ
jgi:nucleoid DNA-binding protein